MATTRDACFLCFLRSYHCPHHTIPLLALASTPHRMYIPHHTTPHHQYIQPFFFISFLLVLSFCFCFGFSFLLLFFVSFRTFLVRIFRSFFFCQNSFFFVLPSVAALFCVSGHVEYLRSIHMPEVRHLWLLLLTCCITYCYRLIWARALKKRGGARFFFFLQMTHWYQYLPPSSTVWLSAVFQQ